MLRFDMFETIPGGDAPYRITDIHPDQQHLAMQTRTYSAVWVKETGRIAWIPSDAIALAWLRNGTQIAALREGPGSSRTFALYSWPDKQLISFCSLTFPWGGWPIDFTISPQNDLAICRWFGQSEAGFKYIDITAQEVSVDLQTSYLLEQTNEVTQPKFSPDGHIWVVCYKINEVWWATDREDPDPSQPARGGEYHLGELMIFQGKQQQPSQTIPLIATVPPGWLPADPNADDVLLMTDPIFLDEHHVKIYLPSGETQVHHVFLGF